MPQVHKHLNVTELERDAWLLCMFHALEQQLSYTEPFKKSVSHSSRTYSPDLFRQLIVKKGSELSKARKLFDKENSIRMLSIDELHRFRPRPKCRMETIFYDKLN